MFLADSHHDDRGLVFSTGDNECGQLGHGTYQSRRVPQKLETLKNYVVVKLAAGARHSAALTDSGTLYTFGNGENGRCGYTCSGHDKIPRNPIPRKVTAIEESVFERDSHHG